MNRREALKLLAAAPIVAPALAAELGRVELDVEALKASTAKVLAPMAEQIHCTIVETFERHGDIWFLTGLTCDGEPIPVPTPTPAFVVFKTPPSPWVDDVKPSGEELTLAKLDQVFRQSEVPRQYKLQLLERDRG